MEMPIKAFWLVNRNINRLLAEKDIRHLNVANAAMSADSANQCRELLVDELGEVFKVDQMAIALEAKPDRDGIEFLRRLSKGKMS